MAFGREVDGLSVILPAYVRNPPISDILNLKRSLESILDQSSPAPREIVLVDDGSDPPIEAFSALLGAAYREVRSIRHKQNEGVAAALNTGLREARYELFSRIDADDYWLAGKLEAQLALFQDSDVTITGTGMIHIGSDGNQIDQYHRPERWHDILSFVCEVGCPFPHASVVGRRSIWRLLGGYPRDARFLHCEDFALWGVWLRFFKPASIAEPLLAHRISDRSISSMYPESQLAGTRIVMQRFRNLRVAELLPAAMLVLSERLGGSMIDAGRVAYLLWKHPYLTMRVPRAAVDSIQSVLADRFLEIAEDGSARNWREVTEAAGPDDIRDPVTIRAAVL